MQRSDFHFDVPTDLIAQFPVKRGMSRLLVLDADSARLEDRMFLDLPSLLTAEDLLVFNDTRVIPARLLGHKSTGGQIEVFVERLLDQHRVLAQIRSGRSLAVGSVVVVEDGEDRIKATVLSREGGWFELYFQDPRPVIEILNTMGHVPLPPYIQRPDSTIDRNRYQTVYARRPGAVAATTAGLHFTESLLQQLTAQGISTAYVTLHVGAGTFQPIRVADLTQHRMHKEWVEVPEETCEAIQATKARGGRVVAVGTTVVRALESASQSGLLCPFQGETDLFIYPGYFFRTVDVLVTNFHLPESSLLMLVCAFAGQERIVLAYRHAVTQQYRFFSYGDAMFTQKKGLPTAEAR